jgi:hypothetical protein
MPRKQAVSLLKIASEAVPCGIYGLEHIGKGYIELMNLPMTSKMVKQKRKEYGKQGIKVYANG